MKAWDLATRDLGKIDLLARLPLATSVLALWRFVFDEQRLSSLWQQYRGGCYEKILTFAQMTHLVSDALLLHGGSGRRSFEKNIESGQLDVSVAAAFGKLSRLPIELSQALLRQGTASLRELFPTPCLRSLPPSLNGLAVLVIDGKAIKKVAKRLKPLRAVAGGLLGGKATVAMDFRSGFALAMQTHPDGDASERPLLKGLLSQVQGLGNQSCLYVADRGFCDLVRLAWFQTREGDHFLIRHQSNTQFFPDEKRPEKTGQDIQGREYVQSWGWLGAEKQKGRRYVRRIVLARGDEEDLALITDFLDAEQMPAVDLLGLYQERWGIERMFQKVTEVFGLEGLIGSTPKACLFQFAFCLLLYNMVQLLTSYVAVAKPCQAKRISSEKLFEDVRDQLIAWNLVFSVEQTLVLFEKCPTAEELRSCLEGILGGVWSERWWKAKEQPNRKPTEHQGKRGHSSVFRILQTHAQKKSKAQINQTTT